MSDLREGIKYDAEKPRYDLLSSVAINELSKVLTFGAQKYGAYNWANGIAYSRVLAAILRHTFAYIKGENNDPETGISHIAHVMANCMFILHYEKFKQEFDDRQKQAYSQSGVVNSNNP